MAGQEQRVAHIEHQQRRHSVIGKALPGFGEGQIGKCGRLAEEGAKWGRHNYRPIDRNHANFPPAARRIEWLMQDKQPALWLR